MVTLLVGLSVVAVSAAGFWLVLFAHHPATQVVVADTDRGNSPEVPENPPSAAFRSERPPQEPGEATAGAGIRIPAVSPRRRLRSSLILCLATIGAAALIGAVLSLIAVVAVLVIT